MEEETNNLLAAFEDLTEALFDLGRENCVLDGFQVETVLGMNSTGVPAAVFASAGGMNANEMAASMPKGTFITSQPLVRAADIIEEAFHRREVRCAIYTAVVDIDDEGYLVTAGVWPEQLFAHAYATPLALAEFDTAVTAGLDGDGRIPEVMRSVVGWLSYLMPMGVAIPAGPEDIKV